MGISSSAPALLLSFDRLGSLSRPSNLRVFITSSTMPRSFKAFSNLASSIPGLSGSSPLKDSSTYSLILECTFICDRWLWMICFSSWTFSDGSDMFFRANYSVQNMARNFRKRKLRSNQLRLLHLFDRWLKIMQKSFRPWILRVAAVINYGLISSWRTNLNVRKIFFRCKYVWNLKMYRGFEAVETLLRSN